MSALQDIFKCPLPRQERDETKSTNLNMASFVKKKKICVISNKRAREQW